MSRSKNIKKRSLEPDSKYGSLLVSKFINILMSGGKKSVAEDIFYSVMDIVESKLKQNPMEVFCKAIDLVKPCVEVKSVRFGGGNHQVPFPVREDRQITLAIRWIKMSALKRPEYTMKNALSAEIIAASQSLGGAYKKKEDTHKMAEASKAYGHFAQFRRK